MSEHHILIIGGNRLVGKPRTQLLREQGHQVSHLSRIPDVTTYGWGIINGQLDSAFQDFVHEIASTSEHILQP